MKKTNRMTLLLCIVVSTTMAACQFAPQSAPMPEALTPASHNPTSDAPRSEPLPAQSGLGFPVPEKPLKTPVDDASDPEFGGNPADSGLKESDSQNVDFSAPAGLKVLGLSDDALTLVWESISQANTYNIYQDDLLIANTEEHLWVLKDLVAGRIYIFSVSGLDEEGHEGSAVRLEVSMPKTSGGSGGSSGDRVGSGSSPELELNIVVSQNPVPGLGHPIYLSVHSSEDLSHLSPAAFQWDCLEDCARFFPEEGPEVIWTAPQSLTLLEESFTIQLTVEIAPDTLIEMTQVIQVLNHHQDLSLTVRGAI